MKDENKTIEIPFEEYKELLIIKGKYEELKSQYKPIYPSGIRFVGNEYQSKPIPPYKVTCDKNTESKTSNI